MNLLSNAIKYTPENGDVKLEVYEEKLAESGKVRLVPVVSDTGIGMTPEFMQNLRNAMNAGDTPTAFRAVHTLKGVALNLGLGSLAHASSQMTEALRGQDSMPESVQPLYEAVQKEHTAVCSALEQLEK